VIMPVLLHAQFYYLVCQNFFLFFLLWMHGKPINVSYGLEREVVVCYQNCLLILRKNWSYVKKKVDTMLALYLLEGDVGGFC
jgi:hypothetical protein